MTKDVGLEVSQLVQRGFDLYERARLYDALAEWESVLRIDAQHVQAGRLVEFCRQRTREVEAGQHQESSGRDTVESPIPQFLAALTERRSSLALTVTGTMWGDSVATDSFDCRETLFPQSGELLPLAAASSEIQRVFDLNATLAPDTVEDLPVDMEGLRASANELVGECRTALDESRPGPAALAAELVLELSSRAPPPGVDDIVEESQALFEQAFHAFIGDLLACPIRAIPIDSIANEGLDERAAFLMSRMDGMTSLADLIDGSGMAHFRAVRVLAALRRAKAVDLLPPLE